MRSELPRIDRRFAVAPASGKAISSGAMIAFRDEWGGVAQMFDLNRLGLSPDLTEIFADAFHASFTSAATATRKGYWKALRTFARFAGETGTITDTADLTTETVGLYVVWLDRQRSPTGKAWGISTRHGRYVPLKIMLEWAMRNRPHLMPEQLQFPPNPFPGRHRTAAPRRLPAAELKAILRACYAEIDIAWSRFEEGRAILEKNPDGLTDDRRELDALLVETGRTVGGIMPWYDQHPGRRSYRSIQRHGGTRMLAQYLHLTVDALVPFFLAIAIQTAANPDSLRNIGRDCLASHPLDPHRIIVDWAKPRAGNAVRRAQRRTFDKRRRYSVPNLVEKVLAMSAPLVAHASPGERDRLFLIRGNRPKGVGVIGAQTLDAGIRRFIARSNEGIAIWNAAHPEQLRCPMRTFSPVLFRGSVAIEHYHAAGGDIRVAQALLNHSRASTTDLYVRGPETQRMYEKTIASLQHRLIGWIAMRQEAHGVERNIDGQFGNSNEGSAEAFSHICINPVAGKAPGSTQGRLCPGFMSCLSCPGLVIPIDSRHLARILQVMRKLEIARDRLDAERWRSIYAPSYRILSEEILPDFPSGLYEAAERLIETLPPLPDPE
ncbi:site-specific integrase [Agrobacterium tumefaciens]|uniref:site-specific integrase n=1 Tax=Agrobacterium tumefaciens TaxID=358 RepID=UPI001572AEF2|nr:site-specific integrase [Agrobacterium tumefaciens]NSX88957.1 site-specific integrase [Agrobacterium tumefaciens]